MRAGGVQPDAGFVIDGDIGLAPAARRRYGGAHRRNDGPPGARIRTVTTLIPSPEIADSRFCVAPMMDWDDNYGLPMI